MEKKVKVFVVQDDGTKDLVPAMAMGEIVVLNTKSLPLFKDPALILHNMKQVLLQHRFCSKDWIIPIGDPLLIGAAVHIAAQINDGLVNCLKWDSRHQKYFQVTLNFKGEKKNNGNQTDENAGKAHSTGKSGSPAETRSSSAQTGPRANGTAQLHP